MKGVEKKDLELKISASGSKLRCASFLFFDFPGISRNSWFGSVTSSFSSFKKSFSRNWPQIQDFEPKIGPSDTESRDLAIPKIGFSKKPNIQPKTHQKNPKTQNRKNAKKNLIICPGFGHLS